MTRGADPLGMGAQVGNDECDVVQPLAEPAQKLDDETGGVTAGREELDATPARKGELRKREPMPVGVALAVLPLHDVAPEGRRPGEVPDRERDVVHPHRRDSALRKVTATVAFMRAARDG